MVKGTYFLETSISLKVSVVLLTAPVLTYVRGSQASILLPLLPLALRFFAPTFLSKSLFSL